MADPVLVPSDRLFLGREQDGAPLLLRRDDLVTHGVILGRTGSGKTGLGAVLVEELALSRIPVIVVDPKGDMTNLALAFPAQAPADFAAWADPTRDPAEEASKWRAGIEASGQSVDRVRAYRESALVTVYAPGWVRTGDVPRVDVLPSLRAPRGLPLEGRAEQARGLVSAILGAAGAEADTTDPRHVFLTEVVLHRWATGHDASIDGVVGSVQDPPFQTVGPMALDRFLPPTERDKLARALVAYGRSAGRWHGGTPLDMGTLLAREGGRPRVSVFTTAHLEPEERTFFVTLLLEALLAWMSEQAGTTQLRAVLMIEEARGLLPPHPLNPPSKAPLARLLAQARAFGLGVVLSTQHPVDLDYKALSNVGTWFLGGLRERDLQRDLAAELRDRGVDEGVLAQLEKRTFLACTSGGAPRTFGARWALSYLRGPIAPSELPRLSGLTAPPPPGGGPGTAADDRVRGLAAHPPGQGAGSTLSSAASTPADERGPAGALRAEVQGATAAPVRAGTSGGPSSAAPAVRDDVIVVNERGTLGTDPWSGSTAPLRATTVKPFQLGTLPVAHGPGPGKNATWRPSLFGQLHVTFSRPRLPTVFEVDVVVALPLGEIADTIDWKRALPLDPHGVRSGAPGGWHKFEEVPAALAQTIFGFKPLQQARRDLEVHAREHLAWALEPSTGPVVTVQVPTPASRRSSVVTTDPAARREELRVRVMRALSDLSGEPLGADPGSAALEWLLGADNPIAAASGTTRLDVAEAWRPPADVARRLERLITSLSSAGAPPPRRDPAAAAAPMGVQGSAPAATAALDLLTRPAVRVDQIGLLWTTV